MTFVSGSNFCCSFDNAKVKFFRGFNAIYSKVGRIASEEVVVNLIRKKCMPILLYATEACPLLSRNIQSLDFSVTRLFMKILRTGSPELVKDCLFNFNFLPVKYQLRIRTVCFLQKFIASLNSICFLFIHNAKRQIKEIFADCNPRPKTACEYRNSILDQFDSGLLL